MHYLIAHAPHAPGRKESVARLLEQLPDAVVIASEGPEHAAIWARRLWSFAKLVRYDHVCLLNDDVILAPDFEARITRAVAAQPAEPISLHCSNPNVANIPGAWARCYHYSGPGVILPPGAAASLLDFVYTLPWSMLSRMNEDVIAIEWAWSKQKPFWYLLPSPLSHDTNVPSTLGYDGHPYRTPVVLGEERDVTDLTAPFVELDWAPTSMLAYHREILRDPKRQICAFCTVREGNIGNKNIMVCTRCLETLNRTVRP